MKAGSGGSFAFVSFVCFVVEIILAVVPPPVWRGEGENWQFHFPSRSNFRAKLLLLRCVVRPSCAGT
jgi:hypothetical protein